MAAWIFKKEINNKGGMDTVIDKIFLGTGSTEGEMAILHSVS